MFVPDQMEATEMSQYHCVSVTVLRLRPQHSIGNVFHV